MKKNNLDYKVLHVCQEARSCAKGNFGRPRFLACTSLERTDLDITDVLALTKTALLHTLFLLQPGTIQHPDLRIQGPVA